MKCKMFLKSFFVLVLVYSILTAGSINVFAASLNTEYTKVEEVSSSDYFREEYFKIRTPFDERNTIYVEGKIKGAVKRLCIRLKNHSGSYYVTVFITPDKNNEFSVKINTEKGNKEVPEVIDGKGVVAQANESYGTQPGYKAMQSIPAGTYHLSIAKATDAEDAVITGEWWKGALGGHDGYCYANSVLIASDSTSNNLKLAVCKGVITKNKSVKNSVEPNKNTISSYKGSYVRYTDKYLKDISFVFKNPSTGKTASMTSKKVEYLHKVADKVTKGAKTDYEKLVKIFEYTAKNIYYDRYAFEQKKNQYTDPYRNIYNQRNKVESVNSTSKGQVATTCQGYSAIVVALARAEGIPARLIYGRHTESENKLWSEQAAADLKKFNHWWAEAYVDGRWIVIDANAGSNNIWKRSSFSAKGIWSCGGTEDYTAFDPSEEQVSNSYLYVEVYKGSNSGKYAVNSTEVSQLKTFLNTKSSGVTNGKRLNKNYVSSKISTWGNRKTDNFTTDGFGRVYKISWPEAKLYGKANFNDFKSLKYLTLYNNKLTALTVKNCTDLKYISATYNNITVFDGTTAKNLETINLKGNKLTSAKFLHKGKTVTLKSNYTKCNFSFNYSEAKTSGNVTLYAGTAPKGYKYLGIYNSKGKRVTKSTTYSFKPSSKTATTYYVKFSKT